MNQADWQEVFNARVRALQAIYPAAHAALVNWGRWSRELKDIPGKTNGLTAPGWTQFYQAPEEWADEEDLQNARRELDPNLLPEARPDRSEAPRSDALAAEAIDIRLHRYVDFPPVWRRVIKATYLSVEIPEYEFPRQAKVGYEGFLIFLEGALERLERQMG